MEKERIDYLITSLRKDYDRISVDWTCEVYAGISLQWDYQKKWLERQQMDT